MSSLSSRADLKSVPPPGRDSVALQSPVPEQADCSLGAALRNESGYTLSEMLVVLVIIGILALLALPRFMNVTTKAKMTEAKINLKQVYTLQQTHYYERDVYAADLRQIGYEQNELVEDGGQARYAISIEEADSKGFTALATAVVDFDSDGTFNVWEVNEEGDITQRTPD